MLLMLIGLVSITVIISVVDYIVPYTELNVSKESKAACYGLL